MWTRTNCNSELINIRNECQVNENKSVEEMEKKIGTNTSKHGERSELILSRSHIFAHIHSTIA